MTLRGWIATYLCRATARAHARRIGGDAVRVLARGVETWQVCAAEVV